MAAKTVVTTRPCAVDHRPAGVARTAPGRAARSSSAPPGRGRRRRRSAPGGSSPTPPGRTSNGPLSGKPRIAAEVPDAGSPASRQRVGVEAVDAQDRDVVARVEVDRLRPAGPAPRPPSRTACRPPRRRRGRSSRPARRRRPSPSPPRRARRRVPSTFTTLAAAARTSGSRAIPARGGATRASGPSIRGNGSSRAQRVQQRPGRRQHRVEPLQDRRALDLGADPVAAALDGERAEDPHDRRAPRAAIRTAPSEAVDASPKPGSRAQAAPDRAPNASNSRRPARAPTSSAPSSPNAGAQGECAPAGEDERPDPRAEPGAERETGEREHAGRRSPVPTRTAPAAARARR